MKDKVIRAYDHLEEALLFVILTAMVAIIFIQVVMRYVFNNALSWSEELARYLYVWSTWVGVSYSARRGNSPADYHVPGQLASEGEEGSGNHSDNYLDPVRYFRSVPRHRGGQHHRCVWTALLCHAHSHAVLLSLDSSWNGTDDSPFTRVSHNANQKFWTE